MGVAAAVLTFADPAQRRQRVKNFLLGTLAAGAVAGLWYLRNWRSVLDYLTSAGYGSASGHFGKRPPVLSWAFWTRVLHGLTNELYLPLATLVTACLVLGIFLAIGHARTLGLGSLATSNWFILVVVVLEGYVAMTSSRNEGTAFSLPWLPALVVLAVAAAARAPQGVLKTGLATLFVVLSMANLLMKSGFVQGLSATVTAQLPGLGTTTVLHGKGIIQDDVVEASGYAPLPATKPFPDFQKRWPMFERRVVERILDHRDRGAAVPELDGSLATESQILTNTSLNLAAAL